MNKDLTYRQRIVRMASIGIVSFTLMIITVFIIKLGIITDINTQRLTVFFILATSVVWLTAIISALVTIFIRKLDIKENVE